jgi:cobalt transporter subunit CbtB
LLAASFGIALLAGVGFAPAAVIHNAAHDGRHVLNFPCH